VSDTAEYSTVFNKGLRNVFGKGELGLVSKYLRWLKNSIL